MIRRFLRDESGAATVDYAVFPGGAVWMGMTVVGDIASATMFVTERVNTRMTYASIVEDIYGTFGPDSVALASGEESGSTEGGS